MERKQKSKKTPDGRYKGAEPQIHQNFDPNKTGRVPAHISICPIRSRGRLSIIRGHTPEDAAFLFVCRFLTCLWAWPRWAPLMSATLLSSLPAGGGWTTVTKNHQDSHQCNQHLHYP